MSKYDKIRVLGDFKIHVCCPSQAVVADFIDTLESFNLTQAIQEPTHSKGHTLDLVLYSGLSPENFEAKDICVSDCKADFIHCGFIPSTCPPQHTRPPGF